MYANHELKCIFLFLLFLSFTSCAQKKKASNNPPPVSTVERFRYQYKPVETQRFLLTFSVHTTYTGEGISEDLRTTISSKVRFIPFKVDSNKNIHFMALLDDAKLVTVSNGARDSMEMAAWSTRRIEIVMNSAGQQKQVFEIEKFPAFPIPGFARAEENGIQVLLSSLFPRLPDSLTFRKATSFQTNDSSTVTYPTRIIHRVRKEKISYTLLEKNDSSARCSYDSRIDATERIFSKNNSSARITEDQITKGSFTVTRSGKLFSSKKTTTIYRDMSVSTDPSQGTVQEITQIFLELHRL